MRCCSSVLQRANESNTHRAAQGPGSGGRCIQELQFQPLREEQNALGMREQPKQLRVQRFTSQSVDEAVAYVLEGRDQPSSSRPHTFALLAAHCGVRRMLGLTDEQRAVFQMFHEEDASICPVLKVTGVRRTSGNNSGLLLDCHVTMVRSVCTMCRCSPPCTAYRQALQIFHCSGGGLHVLCPTFDLRISGHSCVCLLGCGVPANAAAADAKQAV